MTQLSYAYSFLLYPVFTREAKQWTSAVSMGVGCKRHGAVVFVVSHCHQLSTQVCRWGGTPRNWQVVRFQIQEKNTWEKTPYSRGGN